MNVPSYKYETIDKNGKGFKGSGKGGTVRQLLWLTHVVGTDKLRLKRLEIMTDLESVVYRDIPRT